MPSLIVDVGRLELALVNLLSNAIKYRDPAKARRSSRSPRGLETTAMRDLRARQRHWHSGQTISQIFRRFTRAHADRTDLEAVTGVGLGPGDCR